MKPFVYIIVLNWNNYTDTAECIESLKQLNYEKYEILLVDNASVDGSLEKLKKEFPDIEILKNGSNMGFAAGNNAGIEYVIGKGAEYVLVINNDTVVDKNMLKILVEAIDERSSILAPKVYYYDRPDIINSLGTTMNWFRLRPDLGYCDQRDAGQFKGTREAQILVGCALLMSVERIKAIGMFDESFYMIHEDADLSLRNIEQEGKNLVVQDAFMYHKASTTLGKFSALSMYYSIRNILYLSDKHNVFYLKCKSFSGLIFLVLKNVLRFVFLPKRKKEAAAFFAGIKDYFLKKMGKTERVL